MSAENKLRPTPETDEIGAQASKSPHDDYLVMRAHACRLERERDELAIALRDLLDQVRSLNDYELTRDIERYKAEAIWGDVQDRAAALLAERNKS